MPEVREYIQRVFNKLINVLLRRKQPSRIAECLENYISISETCFIHFYHPLEFDVKHKPARVGQYFLCMKRAMLIAIRYIIPQIKMIVAPVGMFAEKEIAMPLKLKIIPSPIAANIIV